MKQDEFTRALRRIMRNYGTEYTAITEKLTKTIFRYMQKGDSVATAYSKARKEINFYRLNADAVENAVYEAMLKGYGINAPAVAVGIEGEAAIRNRLMNVPWTADNMKLSTRLHGVDRVLHNNIESTVNNALRTYKTIKQTAMKLYDGYDTVENVLNEAELPKYLNEIKTLTTRLYSGDRVAARESRIYKAVTRDIRKLKTPSLRAAYKQAADAAVTDKKSAIRKARKMLETGSDKQAVLDMLTAEREKALEKALYVAAQEKTRYYAERIARTESARSYYEGQLEKAKADPDIFGYKWVLSSAHKDDTGCDCEDNAHADIGFGEGIYPKDNLPELPAHPNCMCHFKTVYTWEVEKTDGKDNLPEKSNSRKNRAEEAINGTGLNANNETGNAQEEAQAAFIGTIDPKDTEKTLSWHEEKIVSQDHESAIIVSKNGEVFRVEGGAANVDFAVVGKDKLEGASVTHNHPAGQTRHSFSSLDVGEFFENNLKTLRGVDEEYIYEIERVADTINSTKQAIFNEFSDKYYKELLDMVANNIVPESFSIDRDGYHAIVEMIARDYKFNYRRIKK